MRLKKLLAAAIVGGIVLSQAAGISPASAATFDMACNYDYISFNACLTFYNVVPYDFNTLHVIAGLDERMSQRNAQEIIDNGAYAASLYADDNGSKRWLASLSLSPGWPGAGADGLGIEFDAVVSRYTLDEDPGVPDQDELFAEVSFWDYHGTPHWVTHRTGVVRGDFAPNGGGGPGCLIVC